MRLKIPMENRAIKNSGAMEYPLLHLVVWYGVGILVGESMGLSALFWFVSGLMVVVIGWLSKERRIVAIILALICLGALNMRGRLQPLSADDIRLVAGDTPTLANLRGRLSGAPIVREFEREGRTLRRSVARVSLDSWRRLDTWEPLRGEVVVLTPGDMEGVVFHGERVEISGVLSLPNTPVAPGLFDYRKFLHWQGIHYQLRVGSTNDWLRRDPSTTRPMTESFVALGRKILSQGLKEDEAVRLVWSMVLGWQTGLTAEVAEPFIRSGTLHIFAISGAHIALIAMFLVSAFRFFRVPRHIVAAGVIPLIWFYTAATGWQPSAIRSTLMASVWLFAWILKRPQNLLNTLAASALIMLVWDPGQLFQVGFQLSTGIVLGFALFLVVIDWIESGEVWRDVLAGETLPLWRIRLAESVDLISLRRWRYGDVFHAPVLGGQPQSMTGNLFGRYLIPWQFTSLVAAVVSFPLIVNYFHLVSPIGLLSNMIIVPLSGVGLTSSLVSLITGAAWPWVSEIFNHTSWVIMSAMIAVSEWMAGVRWGNWNVAAWGMPLMLCYYWALAGIGFAAMRRLWRWWIFPWVVCSIFFIAQHLSDLAEPRLTLLPGAAGVMHAHHLMGTREDWLLDAGTESSVLALVKPYLRAQGVNTLSALLLSHGDIHHVQGATLLSEAFPIAEIGVPDVTFRSRDYKDALVQLEWERPVWNDLSRGDSWHGWQVLHPQSNEKQGRADDKSIVLRTTWNGWRILVLPDLGNEGQRLLLEREPDLKADVLIGGIPENGDAFRTGLLEAIAPQLIVVASAEYPVTARGSRQLRERLSKNKATVWFTIDTGAVVFKSSATELIATPMIGSPHVLIR